MNAKTPGLPRSLSSDLDRVDARPIAGGDYDEQPELDEAMLARSVLRWGGRPARPLDENGLFSVRLDRGV